MVLDRSLNRGLRVAARKGVLPIWPSRTRRTNRQPHRPATGERRWRLKAVFSQTSVQLGSGQSEATSSARLVPVGLAKDAFDRRTLDLLQVIRCCRWSTLPPKG